MAVYDRVIGPVLAASTFVGWGYGMVTQISDRTVALWFAFLAGGIIINVIKEELPSEQHGRFWPFLAGVIAYTALVLVVEAFPKSASSRSFAEVSTRIDQWRDEQSMPGGLQLFGPSIFWSPLEGV